MSTNTGIRVGAVPVFLQGTFCIGFFNLGCLFLFFLCLYGLRMLLTRFCGVSGGGSGSGCTYCVFLAGFEANLALRRLCIGSVGLSSLGFEFIRVSEGVRTVRGVFIRYCFQDSFFRTRSALVFCRTLSSVLL